MNMIKMPVGVININMGGSSIISWISRERIDSDKNAVEILKSYKRYETVKQALKDNFNNIPQIAIASNFNSKTYPLRRFRIKGAIWYQGSCDLTYGIKYGGYSCLFNLLQEEITQNFSYKNGLCPIVYSHLTAYGPFNNSLGSFNSEFSEMQKQKPESRTCISVNDISLDYSNANLFSGAIHPTDKKTNGKRMAISARGLVHNKNKAYSVGVVKSAEIVRNSVFVTMDLIGDKIIKKGDTIFDGAVCGKDGVSIKKMLKLFQTIR